jgi:LuxR family transcriptional regulator, maltose regulon positive regulatory protein
LALLRRLPANGHLVLAGRQMPDLPVARLRAHGQLLEIGDDDLAFDDDELERLARARDECDVDTRSLPRLPALADLRLRAGIGETATAAFLWEEILGSLPPERVECLVRCSVVDEIDDDVVSVLSGGALTAATLLDGLPLVSATQSGRFRMHAMMREALLPRLEHDERQSTCRRVAAIETARGNLRAAVQVLAAAECIDDAIEAARRFLTLPTLRRSFDDHIVVRDIIEGLAPRSLVAKLLTIECQWGELSRGTRHDRLPRQLVSLAAVARDEGDQLIEAVALIRSMQSDFLERAEIDDHSVSRLVELSETVPFARQLCRFMLAKQAMTRGDSHGSIACLEPIEGADNLVEAVMQAEQSVLLGRPELAGPGVRLADIERLPSGAELYVSMAMWLRGDAAPELALTLARALSASTVARRVVNPSLSVLSVSSIIGVTAGDHDYTSQNLATAQQIAGWGSANQVRACIIVAAAALACTQTGDEAAAALLRELDDVAPMRKWPPVAHLLSLTMVYALMPATRVIIDTCEFGYATSVAVAAGRALVALRENGDCDQAAALPWHEATILRVHVLPPHLCELALAAGSSGIAAADDVLALVPNHRRLLRAIATRRGHDAPAPRIVSRAQSLLGQFPAQPEATIRVTTMGSLRLVRNGAVVTDPNWERRGRVQELLALLVEERRVTRVRAAELLWPELDQTKAAANLRVTLTYLQRVLEPDRDAVDPPYFVRADSAYLVLAKDVTVDAAEFETAMASAREHDRSGSPRLALDEYRNALDGYQGDYLAHIDADWASTTRIRLRFLAVNGLCRVGELMLARGEPEEAGAWALHARHLAAFNERAVRLFISCQLAVGDRAGAAKDLRALLAGLSAEGLQPEAETQVLCRRLFG